MVLLVVDAGKECKGPVRLDSNVAVCCLCRHQTIEVGYSAMQENTNCDILKTRALTRAANEKDKKKVTRWSVTWSAALPFDSKKASYCWFQTKRRCPRAKELSRRYSTAALMQIEVKSCAEGKEEEVVLVCRWTLCLLFLSSTSSANVGGCLNVLAVTSLHE